MTRTNAGAGWEAAVVVRVPAVDQTISALRSRFGLPRKQNGIAPHITAIVPFLPQAELGEGPALSALRAVCSEIEPFDITFTHTGRFPHVLYLVPEPAKPFMALTNALMANWPQIQPYAGAHREVVPHLTVTTSRPPGVLDAVDEALAPRLPIAAHIDAAQLYFFDGRRWSEQSSIAFAAN
jgi:2'-5' RNA ligase